MYTKQKRFRVTSCKVGYQKAIKLNVDFKCEYVRAGKKGKAKEHSAEVHSTDPSLGSLVNLVERLLKPTSAVLKHILD